METTRKVRLGNTPNGSRRVSARSVNGNLVSAATQAKWKAEPVWDVGWFNFGTDKWESEGKSLTYRQAYNRAHYQAKTYPFSKVGVLFVPGKARKGKKVNGTAVADA
jgi:hypothetical protein